MNRMWSFRPRVEVLGGRSLPSLVHAAVPPALVGTAEARHHVLALSGAVSGFWSQQAGLPDVGASQTLTGNGVVAPLGAVQARGQLQLPGFIVAGVAEGTMDLKNAHGSVTVRLVGPAQPGFSATPSLLTYGILGGTGRYRGARGGGPVTLQETPAERPVCPPNALCALFLLAPHFMLTFGPGPA